MKRITSIALFALVSIVTIGAASAQNRAVQATVPFDFSVGSKVIPAGTYTITEESPNMVLIQNGDHRIGIFSTAYAETNTLKTGELVFNRYGDQYFLSKVLCSSANMSLALPTSKAEHRAQTQEANLSNSSQVFLALNR